MTDHAVLPTPQKNADSAPYWEAAAQGRLLLRACNSCGQKHFMPRYLCPFCWSEDLEWIEASGRGSIHSFTIVHRASDPAYAGRTPYVLALVDLYEGPRMMANIVGESALECRIGESVNVVFEPRADGQAVPQFERANRS